jgi:serine/threonine protein phosphatase 1
MFGGLFKSHSTTSKERPARTPEGVRIYAIGDIHGRSDLLDRVHDLISDDLARARDIHPHLVYLGDYIDRGSDSAGVLERLCAPPPPGIERTLLRGNHEEMLARFLTEPAAGTAWRHLGGMETLLSYRIDVGTLLAEKGFEGLADALAERMPPHHRQLLAGLETCVTLGDYFFCHAGVRPGVPLERQNARDLLWIREDFLTSHAAFGHVVVHGHSPVNQPEFHHNRINIDTGAYVTGHLTCLVLEGEERRILST